MFSTTNFYLHLIIIRLFAFIGFSGVKDPFESTFQLNYKCVEGDKEETEDERKVVRWRFKWNFMGRILIVITFTMK